MDIKERIQKLLALSTSSNENEAISAMLKAKELMMKHKLTMEDLGQNNNAVIQLKTGVSFSKRNNMWMLQLSQVIAKNNCCQMITRRMKGKQTHEIVFVGFQNEVDICRITFCYAVSCVISVNKATKKYTQNYDPALVKAKCDSYGRGFAAGLDSAYKDQQEQHAEWGLIAVVPQKVNEAIEKYGTTHFSATIQRDHSSYNRGFTDGNQFASQRRLER